MAHIGIIIQGSYSLFSSNYQEFMWLVVGLRGSRAAAFFVNLAGEREAFAVRLGLIGELLSGS